MARVALRMEAEAERIRDPHVEIHMLAACGKWPWLLAELADGKPTRSDDGSFDSHSWEGWGRVGGGQSRSVLAENRALTPRE